MHRWLLFVSVGFILCTSSAVAQTRIDRPSDPVVLTGAQIPALIGTVPTKIVAYRRAPQRWVQIPVQVDERLLQDIVLPYGGFAGGNYPPSPSNPRNLVYADPTTNVGPDTDTLFDADDELVFMAKDAGLPAWKTRTPFGALKDSGVEVKLTDPIGGKIGYVYLFVSAETPNQSAGFSYVAYNTNLASTSLFPAHANGLNLESSTVTTPKYSWKFSAEWVSDFLTINDAAGVPGPDILDRHKAFFANGTCGRHENTFSNAENAFITNRAGAIRVIRSYLGANSGPLTQRTHLFYEARHDILTDLRVHSIPSIYDAMDYTPAASGMAYCSSANPTPVLINGMPDTVTAGDLNWEAVSGGPGSLVIVHRKQTTFTGGDATFTSYYDDNSASPASNCTGDGQAYGTSGVGVIFGTLACTDPIGGNCGVSSSNFRSFRTIRTLYFSPTVSNACEIAPHYSNRITHPLSISVRSY